ncbi:MAG: hypothetical protein ACREBV_00430 [Candidatus Zixiibacteriota bacterium]
MRKKILIAEQSDTTRGVAENVLRQQGYEVISVSTGDKALEVLEFSKPNLILVDSSMTAKGKRSLFDRLQEGAITASIPFLLIADENDDSLPYPSEVIVTRPLDPKDLVLKVSVLTGSAGAKSSAGANPLDEGGLEDDILDAALGMDEIDVTDSEILDSATAAKKKTAKNVEKMIGMEQDHELEEDSQKNKVESLRIEESDPDMQNLSGKEKDSTKTGRLEILGEHEQFAIGNESLLETSGEYTNHDYEWFINEMKRDVTGGPGKPGQSKPSPSSPKSVKTSSQPAAPTAPAKKTSSGKAKNEGGVEKFIEDFKKEVEKIAEEPSETPVKLTRKTVHKAEPVASAKASAGPDSVTIDQVEVFTRQFVNALAEKVAEKIATKIDAQKLLSLIKNEIVSKSQKQ